MRSSSRGSAQCTSSNTKTIGRRGAAFSTSRRTAQNVSSGSPGSPTPSTAAALRGDAVAVGLVLVEERGEAGHAPSRRTHRRRATPRHGGPSATGANVAPPAGSHRTTTTRARSAAAAPSSRTSRDLPTPGVPTIEASCGRRSPMATSSTAVEALELAGPPDERRGRRVLFRALERLEQERRDRLRLPLQLQRGDGPELRPGADEPERGLADEHLAGPSRLLEPGGDVDRRRPPRRRRRR